MPHPHVKISWRRQKGVGLVSHTSAFNGGAPVLSWTEQVHAGEVFTPSLVLHVADKSVGDLPSATIRHADVGKAMQLETKGT